MDKRKDLQIYRNLDRRFGPQDHSIEKRKVTQSRIFKLSVVGADAPYSTICRILYNSKEFQKSLFPLKKATIINPRNIAAQIYLAGSFLKLGKGTECFSVIKKALSISPSEPALHSWIIKIFREHNQLEDLLSFYQEIAEMIRDKESVLELWICSAEILEDLKRIPQALEQYRKASETGVMKLEQRFHYGDVLSRERRFEEAFAQFESIWKLNQANQDTINKIASLHYELGRVEKSFEVFEEIIKKRWENIMTSHNFLLVLYHLEKDEKVTEMHEDILQRYPQRYREEIQESYRVELKQAEEKLANHLDEKSREFYIKKLKGLKMVLSVLDRPQKVT